MTIDDIDRFCAIVAASVASPAAPSPPRNAAEAAIGVAVAAFETWRLATSEPPAVRSVPVGELVEMRRRCRQLERDLAEARSGKSFSLRPQR